MKNVNFTLLILVFIPFFSLASGNLFKDMDEESLQRTGIDKLTESERVALTQWLNGSREKIIKQNKKENMGFRTEESDRVDINSSIVGEFNGWRGKNIFTLENGQVWKQAEKTTFYIPTRNNPNITIQPKSMGSWMLYVDGFGRGVKVKRIK
jgi:hypothetical protein